MELPAPDLVHSCYALVELKGLALIPRPLPPQVEGEKYVAGQPLPGRERFCGAAVWGRVTDLVSRCDPIGQLVERDDDRSGLSRLLHFHAGVGLST